MKQITLLLAIFRLMFVFAQNGDSSSVFKGREFNRQRIPRNYYPVDSSLNKKQVDSKVSTEKVVATDKIKGCSGQDPIYLNKYKRSETYKIDHRTAVKTIHISFHVWYDDAFKNGDWSKGDSTNKDLKQIAEWMDAFLKNNVPSSELFAPTDYNEDTHFRIVLDSIYYYSNSSLYKGKTGHILTDFVKQNYPERMKALPIHLANGVGGGGGNAERPKYLSDDHLPWVITFMDHTNNGIYSIAQHLIHELCHTFDLGHTYDGSNCDGIWGGGDSCCPESFAQAPYDFVSDVFNFSDNWCNSPDGFCYECSSDKIDVSANTPNEANSSNNIMSGRFLLNYHFSPLQLGKMHKSSHLKSTRQYISGYSTFPMIVKENETWDFSFKSYQDIVIKSGTTITITCEIQMVPEARIIIERGATLILDGGKIKLAKNADAPWQGIVTKGNQEKKRLFKRKKKDGVLIMKNEGEIEGCDQNK